MLTKAQFAMTWKHSFSTIILKDVGQHPRYKQTTPILRLFIDVCFGKENQE